VTTMTPQLSVLLVEDDANVRLGCEQAMQLAGIAVTSVASAEAAQQQVVAGFPGIVVTDMRLPGTDGLAFVRWARGVEAALPVIMITGHGDVTLAVEAMRSGAYDFIPKPFSPEHLVEVVQRALEKRALTLEVEVLRRRLEHREGVETMLIGRSPQMAAVRRRVQEVAGSAVDVLIRGETGTGNELISDAIHYASPRARNACVRLNCAALSENLLESELFGYDDGAFTGARRGGKPGKFELANGGSIFLDEIGDMTLAMQAKLLRVLQEREIERVGATKPVKVDVRVIAATNRDLETMIERGEFRQDLYYRLNIISLQIPPLRERKEDIPLLASTILKKLNNQTPHWVEGVSPEAMEILMEYSWPGNVRELENILERAVNLMDEEAFIAPEHLPPVVKKQYKNKEADDGVKQLAGIMGDTEKQAIYRALEAAGGNKSKAAQILGIHRSGFYQKIKKYGLRV